MKFYLSINNLVSMEAVSRVHLNRIVLDRYGVDISEFKIGEAEPIRKKWDVEYWVIGQRK